MLRARAQRQFTNAVAEGLSQLFGCATNSDESCDSSLQFEHPKLAVTAMVNEGDFADQLEQAIKRSRKVIEAKPMTEATDNVSDPSNTKPTVQASNGHKPSVPDRRYRRW